MVEVAPRQGRCRVGGPLFETFIVDRGHRSCRGRGGRLRIPASAIHERLRPFLDSILLAFSVLGQILMMERRVENWWAWLLVNTLAVPLYASRGLQVTSILYAAFWVNALVSLSRWRRLANIGVHGYNKYDYKR